MQEKEKVYRSICNAIIGYKNCINNPTIKETSKFWAEKWLDKIRYIEKSHLPHGSGIDGRNEIAIDESNENKLVIYSSYHRMNEAGFYMEWIDYRVVIRAELLGINITIVGRFGKYQDIKDYLSELYYDYLNRIFIDKREKIDS